MPCGGKLYSVDARIGPRGGFVHVGYYQPRTKATNEARGYAQRGIEARVRVAGTGVTLEVWKP